VIKFLCSFFFWNPLYSSNQTVKRSTLGQNWHIHFLKMKSVALLSMSSILFQVWVGYKGEGGGDGRAIDFSCQIEKKKLYWFFVVGKIILSLRKSGIQLWPKKMHIWFHEKSIYLNNKFIASSFLRITLSRFMLPSSGLKQVLVHFLLIMPCLWWTKTICNYKD